MKILNLSAAKAHLSALISEVEKSGEIFIICKHGKPIAELIPHKKRQSRLTPHPIMKDVVIKYDPVDPLSEEEWGAIE